MSYFDAQTTVQGLERKGFLFSLIGRDFTVHIPADCDEAVAIDEVLQVYRTEIVRFLREREKEGKMVKTKRTQQAAPKPSPAEAKHRAMLAHAQKMVATIPNAEATFDVLRESYPRLFHELTGGWIDRLHAAVGVVSVERFQKLCDEFVDRWIQVCAFASSPRLLERHEAKKERRKP